MSLLSNSKPIVHIATDEKFIDAAYEIYEKAFPDKNRFLILLNEGHDKIKYLSEEIPYEFIETNDRFLSKVVDKINQARLVIFHSMNYQQTEIALLLSDSKIKLVWSVFGAEVYKNPYLFGKEIYGKQTYKRFEKNYGNIFKNKLRPYYYRMFKGQQDPFERRIKAMEQMDFVGVLYKEELQLYKERINFKDEVKQLKFTYYPLDVVVNKTATVTGNNILLGNSAYSTNNHLEAFELLEKFNIGDKKIICPLSYGDKEYACEIKREGKKAFGSNFESLIDFLPLKEYQQVLQGCGIVIMNHYRQQAVGNVLNTLYMGAKVFLSNKNTLFHYLKKIGCHIYCIEEDLIPVNQKIFTLLNVEQIEHNRKMLKEKISLERVCTELQKQLNPIVS